MKKAESCLSKASIDYLFSYTKSESSSAEAFCLRNLFELRRFISLYSLLLLLEAFLYISLRSLEVAMNLTDFIFSVMYSTSNL
jgi:hypothetical protein